MNEDSIALSVKRRRLTLGKSKTVQYATKTRTYKRKKRILHLPDELLYNIFSKLSIIDVASIISVVCQRFELVAVNIMNIKFCNINNQIERIRANQIENITSNQCEENVIFTYKMLNILDIIHNQYKIIRASTWRYAFFQLAPRENYLAICAGFLIDEFELLLKYLNDSERICNFMFEIPNKIATLKDLSKEYLDKFEKYICETLQNTPDKCGCKIIDLLDCFNGCERKVVNELCENNTCNLSITYTLERAWFTVLNLTDNFEIKPHEDIYEDLRYMYKRIRLLLCAHNSIYFEEAISCQKNSPFVFIDTSRPKFDMYCSSGEMCDKFYFYGTMTEGYMVERLARGGINIHLDNDNFDDEDVNENPFFVNIDTENTITNIHNTITKPILTFEVNLKGPLNLSPWCVLKKYNTNGDLNMIPVVKEIQTSMGSGNKCKKNKSDYLNTFKMTLIVTSNTAKENRLPYKYKYCIIQKTDGHPIITREDIGEV